MKSVLWWSDVPWTEDRARNASSESFHLQRALCRCCRYRCRHPSQTTNSTKDWTRMERENTVHWRRLDVLLFAGLLSPARAPTCLHVVIIWALALIICEWFFFFGERHKHSCFSIFYAAFHCTAVRQEPPLLLLVQTTPNKTGITSGWV